MRCKPASVKVLFWKACQSVKGGRGLQSLVRFALLCNLHALFSPRSLLGMWKMAAVSTWRRVSIWLRTRSEQKSKRHPMSCPPFASTASAGWRNLSFHHARVHLATSMPQHHNSTCLPEVRRTKGPLTLRPGPPRPQDQGVS